MEQGVEVSEPKPFDLEKAKAGEAIMQRDGTPVKFVAYEPEAFMPVVVFANGNLSLRYAGGNYANTPNHGWDLVMAPKTRKVTVRLYRNVPDRNLMIAMVDRFPTCFETEWTCIKEETWEVPV